MLTPELLTKAIQTSHDLCQGEEGCIHEKVMKDCLKMLQDEVRGCLVFAIEKGHDPGFVALHTGIHIGYRLRQLEDEADKTPVPTDKVN